MSNYFSKVPDFEYVSRLPDAKIGDYIRVKNLFKRAALKNDILSDLAFHTKYEIHGDDKMNEEDINFIEKEFNNIMLEDGYNNLFRFPKFSEFLKTVTSETN